MEHVLSFFCKKYNLVVWNPMRKRELWKFLHSTASSYSRHCMCVGAEQTPAQTPASFFSFPCQTSLKYLLPTWETRSCRHSFCYADYTGKAAFGKGWSFVLSGSAVCCKFKRLWGAFRCLGFRHTPVLCPRHPHVLLGKLSSPLPFVFLFSRI